MEWLCQKSDLSPLFFPSSLLGWWKLILVFWCSRALDRSHSHFIQCVKLSHKMNFTLRWRQISVACQESNKSECMVWVVGCSAGCCWDGRLWPKACCVESVSQQCFYRVVNGLFPRCGLSLTQNDEWHFKGDVSWNNYFAKFLLLMFPLKVFFPSWMAQVVTVLVEWVSCREES